MALGVKNYNEAIGYFEKGTELAPDFPSNYYWAAKIYCSSEDPMWGLLYGEIFMNLERNSNRTAEISKLLFDTYKNNIKFISPGKVSVSFSKNSVITTTDLKNMKLPYSLIYEPTMGMAVANEKEIDINSLDVIRQNFLNFYIQRGFDKSYPNTLITYQDEVSKAGQMEAYDHWLLMQGDEDGFKKWQDANPAKWDGFIKWFTPNKLQMNDDHRFYRNMYQ